MAKPHLCVVSNLMGKKPKKAKVLLSDSDCAFGLKKKSKKRRKYKQVVSQSVPAGTSISDTQPITFKVSERRKRNK